MHNCIYEVHVGFFSSRDTVDETIKQFTDPTIMLKYVNDRKRKAPYVTIKIYESIHGEFKLIDSVAYDNLASLSNTLRSVPMRIYDTVFSFNQWSKLIDWAEAVDKVIHSKWLHEDEIEEYDNLCSKAISPLDDCYDPSSMMEFLNALKKASEYSANITDRLAYVLK